MEDLDTLSITEKCADLKQGLKQDLEQGLSQGLEPISDLDLTFETKPLDLNDFRDDFEPDFDLRWNANLDWVKAWKLEQLRGDKDGEKV
jgi:hypothetical protein